MVIGEYVGCKFKQFVVMGADGKPQLRKKRKPHR